jgi:hypothetical protein
MSLYSEIAGGKYVFRPVVREEETFRILSRHGDCMLEDRGVGFHRTHLERVDLVVEIIENRVALGNEADMGLIRVGNEDHRIAAFELFQKIFRNQDFRNEYVRPYFAERLEIHLETAFAAHVLVELRRRYLPCFVTSE